MSDYQKELIALLKGLTGQANILTIPRAFIDLTGDLKAALFLSQCVYWSSRSETPGIFYKTYQDWQAEIALSRYEIDQVRKKVKRWVSADLRMVGSAPVLHYRVDMQTLTVDLIALYSQENQDVQTSYSQNDLLETDKSNCQKLTNRIVGNSQNDLLETDKSLNKELTEITTEITTKTTTEINSSIGFASQTLATASRNKSNAAGAAAENSNGQRKLPPEIETELKSIGWRGSLAEVEKAWREDPERVRQWLWYAGKQGMSAALLRTVLRSAGEYPPELDPNSPAVRRRYIEGPYADIIQH
jgi:hypothetical protein